MHDAIYGKRLETRIDVGSFNASGGPGVGVSPGQRVSRAFVSPSLYNGDNGGNVGEIPEERSRASYPDDIRQGLHLKGGGCETPRNELS